MCADLRHHSTAGLHCTFSWTTLSRNNVKSCSNIWICLLVETYAKTFWDLSSFLFGCARQPTM
ncbi:hypothetical protein RvY_03147 [Ramazzottius varieornatus]|uniref:Uncharacterized protein n=1 Tax=Ramazzottius varieornatus TaxID=947166 RepID=A0A1D1UWJ2_RAMVA|nr:hypothetical protein RvY_03147 [Ramazzottius varieornatus]